MQMPPMTVHEQTEYASLGWRFAAVLVDTVVLFGALIVVLLVYLVVLAGQGRIDLNDPASAQTLSRDLSGSNLVNLTFLLAFFVYYAVLEGLLAASVGKLVFGMRVTMLDGSRPTATAILLRNLIRIPEALFVYAPSGISCLASPRRQRLGDLAARTIVVRRHAIVVPAASSTPSDSPAYGGSPHAAPPGAPPYGPSRGAPAPPAPEAPVVAGAQNVPSTAPAADALAGALTSLKTAALATRGAHLSYLRFSERELADGRTDPSKGYSDEYVSAWFTLADAVAALRALHDRAATSARSAGQTLDQACAAHPDLTHLLHDLAPYFTATTDEEIHEAFLAVARADTPPSAPQP